MKKWVWIVLAVLVCACKSEEEVDVQALIEKEAKAKYHNFMKIKAQNCKEQLYIDVRGYVDSSVVAELTVKDSLTMPPRPERPEFVGQIVLDDSTRIAPVIGERNNE